KEYEDAEDQEIGQDKDIGHAFAADGALQPAKHQIKRVHDPGIEGIEQRISPHPDVAPAEGAGHHRMGGATFRIHNIPQLNSMLSSSQASSCQQLIKRSATG